MNLTAVAILLLVISALSFVGLRLLGIERLADIATIFGTVAMIVLAFLAYRVNLKDYFYREVKIKITSPLSGAMVKDRVTVDGIVTGGPYDHYKIKLNNTELESSLPFKLNTKEYPDGSYILSIKVFRREEEKPIASEATNFEIDNSPPNINIFSPKEGQIIEGYMTIRASTIEQESEIAYISLDGSRIPSINQYNTKQLEDGEHRLSVVAEDLAGNVGREVIRFVVDNKSVQIKDLGLREGVTLTGPKKLRPKVINYSKAIFSWYRDGKLFSHKQNPTLKVADLKDGEHEVTLRVEDSITGKLTKLQVPILVDTTPPEIELPKSIRNPDKDVFKWNRLEPVPLQAKTDDRASLKCKVNGKPHPTTYLDLNQPQYTPGEKVVVEFVASDNAGNTTKVDVDIVPETPTWMDRVKYEYQDLKEYVAHINENKVARALLILAGYWGGIHLYTNEEK